MISILLNSRTKDYNNSGNIKQFVSFLTNSIYDPKNIEIIFKIDTDDDLSIGDFYDVCNFYTDLQFKAIISKRYYYKGLNIGYEECFKLIDDKCKIVICMADDFVFNKKYWDKGLLERIAHFDKHAIFTVQNFIGSPNKVPISPMWSPNLISVVGGFGPSFATDTWSFYINQILKIILPDNIIIYDIGIDRIICGMDGPEHARWNTDREESKKVTQTPEYTEYLRYIYKEIYDYVEFTKKLDSKIDNES